MSATPTAGPQPEPIDLAEPLAPLERQYQARIGLYAFDTATGAVAAHRADERFAFASTIKALAAAVVLDQTTTAELDEVLRFTADDLLANSPVTEQRLAEGVTLREAIQAAIRQSDNTAANLLFDRIGGPAALQAALREAGDATTVVSRREPELNRFTPGDDRDTTTAEALARTVAWYTLEDGLAEEDRESLIEAMRGARTGDGTIRAGTPDGWTVANKTGTGSHGTRNDVAVLWPEDGSGPLVLAVMTRTVDPDGTRDDALLADATRVALAALTGVE